MIATFVSKYSKKIFIATVYIVLLISVDTRKAHANIPTIDFSAIAKLAEQYGQQVLSVAQEQGINISTGITAANTTALRYKELILDPLQNQMNLLTSKNSANQIINLVNGSSGGNALLVANPEKFVEEKGINSLQASYNLVDEAGGSYSEAIKSRIEDLAKSKDTENTIVQATRSVAPSIGQENICLDKNLSYMAEEDVTEGFSVEADTGAYDARRSELYNALCTCDPGEDRECEARIKSLCKQRPSMCGWDYFNAITDGDNAFTKENEAIAAAQEDAADKEYWAGKDLEWGDGVQSSKTCDKYDSKGLCVEEAVVAPGSFYNEAYITAKLTPLLSNIAGTGKGVVGGDLFGNLDGILGLVNEASGAVGNIANVYNSFNGTINSVTGAIGNVTNTFGSLNPDIISARTPRPNTSTVTNSSFTPDLAGDTSRRDSSIVQIKAVLNAHQQAIDDLVTTDTAYISEVNNYKDLVTSVKTCYETRPKAVADAARYSYTIPSTVYDFYNNETSASNGLINTLTQEKNNAAPTTKTFIQTKLNQISTSVSSEEITSLTNQYRDAIDSDAILDPSINTRRSSDLASYRSTVQIAQMAVGTIGKQKTECDAALAAVQAAIAARDAAAQIGGGL